MKHAVSSERLVKENKQNLTKIDELVKEIRQNAAANSVRYQTERAATESANAKVANLKRRLTCQGMPVNADDNPCAGTRVVCGQKRGRIASIGTGIFSINVQWDDGTTESVISGLAGSKLTYGGLF